MNNGPRLEGPDLFVHPVSKALIAVVHERGFEEAGVEEICERGGIDAEEFARRLGTKAQATTAVFEAYIDDFRRRVEAAYDGEGDWPANLRAAAYETVRWMNAYPEATWFGMVGVLGAGDMALVAREGLFIWCAGLIDAGREAAPDPAAVPAAASMIAVGAAVEVVRRQQEGTFGGTTAETVPQLMSAAVRPYLGEATAQAELGVTPPGDLAESS
jgi:AcrR family transcriptional regulator